MKSVNLLLTIGIILFSRLAVAQWTANDIVGKWATEDNKVRIEILKSGDSYSAKIISIPEPNNASGKPKTDKNNLDKSLQSRPIIGLPLVTGLTFSGKKWVNGRVYSIQRGETLPCTIELADRNTLRLKASKGIVSKTQTWKRL